MVWSDPQIQSLAKNFVAVADEVYMLYPEDPGNLNRVKDRPEHKFFRSFGESMPKGAWNHPGTKQGIYMMGPNAEYLEGRFAAGSEPEDIRRRLSRALTRWNELTQEKGYQNLAIPQSSSSMPPGISGDLILRVNSRDLPRGGSDASGTRFENAQRNDGYFLDYVKWAWNEHWVALPRATDFVPQGNQSSEVPAAAIQHLALNALIDNVRGQVPEWRPGDLKLAQLTMNTVSKVGTTQTITYTGSVELASGNRSFRAKLVGGSKFNSQTQKFESFELAAVGTRRGAGQFNRRENDPGPAPLGISLSLRQK